MTPLTRTKPIAAAIAVTLLACIAALMDAHSASAHANLAESSPKPSEELEVPPERVIIWFTEPIETAFSSITVLDATGADVAAGDTEIDSTEPTAMWIALAPLENGTYTVVWRNVSSVDGHRVTGSFLFAVGEPLGAESQIVAQEQPLLQSPFDPMVRWVIYIGIAVFAGGLFFELLISTRAARSEDQHHALAFAQFASTRFRTVAFSAIVLVILAQIAQLMLQTSIAFDDALAGLNPTRLIDVVTQSDWGRFWSWRFTAAILAVIALFGARQLIYRTKLDLNPDETDELPLTTETPWGIAAIALSGIYLLLISLTSHNAATPTDIRWFAIVTDLIHISAATIWVGGIAYLVVGASMTIRSNDPRSHAALLQCASSFAPLAIVATAIIIASGIVSSLMQVTIPEAIDTPYGRVLGAKVFLLGILLALAIKNNRSVDRKIRSDSPDTKSLSRYIAVELGVAFLVLLATAGLASLEPARQYAERQGIGGGEIITHTEVIAGAHINVKLEPANVGANTLTVDLTSSDSNPFADADEVRARIKYLDDDFGEYFTPLDNTSPGVWHLDEITIGIAGAYQLDVTIVRSDAFDSHISTRFSATSQTFASDLIRPSAKDAMFAFGGLILVAGIAYLIVATFSHRPVLSNLSAHHGGSIVISIIGVAVIFNSLSIGIGLPTEGRSNLFPLNQESVEIGRTTYTATCATCHGDTGRGEGPAGLALNPSPADLAIHVPLHTDGELYNFIADGIEGTPMVAQLGNLTSDEIWHLVNYIRTIAE